LREGWGFDFFVQEKIEAPMTEQKQSTITADNDAVVTEIEIAAPPDRVFQAIVDREQAMQWGGGENFQIILWEMDVRPGGEWRFVSKERSGKNPPGLDQFEHHGEYLDPEHRTVVRWDLTPTKNGTHLKVTHSGLAPLSGAAQGYSQGWPGLVQQIKNFVEK
jgi:uncharacterized protein YndB with AHSA1/START domain